MCNRLTGAVRRAYAWKRKREAHKLELARLRAMRRGDAGDAEAHELGKLGSISLTNTKWHESDDESSGERQRAVTGSQKKKKDLTSDCRGTRVSSDEPDNAQPPCRRNDGPTSLRRTVAGGRGQERLDRPRARQPTGDTRRATSNVTTVRDGVLLRNRGPGAPPASISNLALSNRATARLDFLLYVVAQEIAFFSSSPGPAAAT